jgi:hypothetical protein
MSRTKKHWMLARKDRLTKAQEATLPAICEKWKRFALSTEPADRKKAQDLIKATYKAYNERAPRMIWISSPFQLSAEQTKPFLPRLKFPLRRSSSLDYSISLGALRFYKDPIVKRVQGVISAAVPGIVSPLMLLPRDVTIIDNHLGTENAQSLAFADVFATQRLGAFIYFGRVLEFCAGIWIYKKAVVFLERPRILKLDELNRPHSLDGPAVEYRDGSVVHAIHGLQVAPKWIDTPAEKIDIAEVMSEENAEVRRALIAKFGFERLLKATPYRTVSKWRSNALIEFTFPGRKWISAGRPGIETLRLRALHLRWEDKTGRKETVLPVPRTLRQFGADRPANINSCEQVRRWTLGWPKEALAIAET